MVYAVKFPRHLAPTVGLAASRIEIQAGARGEVGSIVAVGKSIQFGSLGFVMDDIKWQPASSPVDHSEIVPIGDINIIINYVGAHSCTDSNHDTDPIGVELGDSTEGYA
jgi:hypothetical protein